MASKLTIIVGVILIAMSVVFYFLAGGPGEASLTALIPGGFGLVLAILRAIGLNEARRKLAMHIAVVVAVVGIAGGARIFGAWAEATAMAQIAHVTLMALCVLLLVVYIRSFIAARKAA
jgi:hypothetical protein